MNRIRNAFYAAVTMVAGSAAAASPDIGYDDYIAGAVATQRCGGATLSMIEEMRLVRVMRRDLGGDISSGQISDSLAAARFAPVECGSAAVQDQIQTFSVRIKPQLQSAITLTK